MPEARGNTQSTTVFPPLEPFSSPLARQPEGPKHPHPPLEENELKKKKRARKRREEMRKRREGSAGDTASTLNRTGGLGGESCVPLNVLGREGPLFLNYCTPLPSSSLGPGTRPASSLPRPGEVRFSLLSVDGSRPTVPSNFTLIPEDAFPSSIYGRMVNSSSVFSSLKGVFSSKSSSTRVRIFFSLLLICYLEVCLLSVFFVCVFGFWCFWCFWFCRRFFRFFVFYFSKECVYCGVVPCAPQPHSRIHSAS